MLKLKLFSLVENGSKLESLIDYFDLEPQLS